MRSLLETAVLVAYGRLRGIARRRLLDRLNGSAASETTLSAVVGTKKSSRITTKDGGHILVELLQARPWREIDRYQRLADLLTAHGVDVPRVVSRNRLFGLMIVEDLGSGLLKNVRPAGSEGRSFDDVLSLLERLLSIPAQDAAAVAAGGEFAQFLQWRLEQTRRLFWREHCGIEGDPTVGALCAGLAELTLHLRNSRFLVHGDIHADNLISSNGRLFVLDFQDARLGPPLYDLACFLVHPYLALSAAEQDALRESFYARLAARKWWAGYDEYRSELAVLELLHTACLLGSFSSHYCYVPHLEGLCRAFFAAAPNRLHGISTDDLEALAARALQNVRSKRAVAAGQSGRL